MSGFIGALSKYYANLIGIGFLWQLAAYVICWVGFRFFFSSGTSGLAQRSMLNNVSFGELLRCPTTRGDILNWLAMTVLWIPLTVATIGLFSIDVQRFLIGRFGERAPLMHGTTAIVAVQFVGILLSRELGQYASHYSLHKVPALWSIHRAHHSAEALTYFTAVRGHPLEAIYQAVLTAGFGGLGGGSLLFLTGTSLLPQTAVALTLLATFYTSALQVVAHSHVPISYGKLSCVFYSPLLHQIHHSAETRHRDRNLGANLSLFDWIFGTLYLPQGNETYRWGLNAEEIGTNNPHIRLKDMYLEPIAHAWRTLTRTHASQNGSSPAWKPRSGAL